MTDIVTSATSISHIIIWIVALSLVIYSAIKLDRFIEKKLDKWIFKKNHGGE